MKPLAYNLLITAGFFSCIAAAQPAIAQTYIETIGSDQLFSPLGVAVDTANGSNVLVADRGKITVFSSTGTLIRTIGQSDLGSSNAVAVDTANASNIIVSDPAKYQVAVFSAAGSLVRTIGSMGSGNGQLASPIGVAVDSANDSNVVVADTQLNRIEVFTADGTFIRAFGSAGSGNGQFAGIGGVAVDTANGGNIVVTDFGNARVEVFTAAGDFIRSFGQQGSGNGDLFQPEGVAVDLTNNSNIVVADALNGRIEVFTSSGTFVKAFRGGTDFNHGELLRPAGVAIDTENAANVVASDSVNAWIGVYTDTFLPAPLGAAILPGSRSVELGTAATVYATMLNTASTAQAGCTVSLPTGSPAGLSVAFQTTDSQTNAPTGQANQPVSIAANGSQSFLLSFTANSALSVSALAPVFGCTGVQPAGDIAGVDTIDLSFSATPTPDIIAIAVASGGVLTIPQSTNGAGAFAVATIDAGAAGTITASTDTGSASLPLSATICPTNPTTGACLTPPSATASTAFQANGTQTYSVFATASAPIPFAPGTARVFVHFTDASGASRGSTSVAVDTQ